MVPDGDMHKTSWLPVLQQWTNQLEPGLSGVVVVAEAASLRTCKLRLERRDGASG